MVYTSLVSRSLYLYLNYIQQKKETHYLDIR